MTDGDATIISAPLAHGFHKCYYIVPATENDCVTFQIIPCLLHVHGRSNPQQLNKFRVFFFILENNDILLFNVSEILKNCLMVK